MTRNSAEPPTYRVHDSPAPRRPGLPQAHQEERQRNKSSTVPSRSELFVSEVIMRLRILLTALLLACASTVHAQFDTGLVAGIVRDSSNAGVPGATVTVENEANKDRRTAVTNSSGFYAVPDRRSAPTASPSSSPASSDSSRPASS